MKKKASETDLLFRDNCVYVRVYGKTINKKQGNEEHNIQDEVSDPGAGHNDIGAGTKICICLGEGTWMCVMSSWGFAL